MKTKARQGSMKPCIFCDDLSLYIVYVCLRINVLNLSNAKSFHPKFVKKNYIYSDYNNENKI